MKLCVTLAALLYFTTIAHAGAAPIVLLDGYRPECGIDVATDDEILTVFWNGPDRNDYRVVFNTAGEGPLVREATVLVGGTTAHKLLADCDPYVNLTVGSREIPRGNAPKFPQHVFFDNPAKRPFESFGGKLDLQTIECTSAGRRTTISFGKYTIGPFHGALDFTFYAGSPLVKFEAVVSTQEPDRAIIYSAGLEHLKSEHCRALGYKDVLDQWHDLPLADIRDQSEVKSRNRLVVVEPTAGGSVAIFPPPHQFFFPKDYSDNLGYLWRGRIPKGDHATYNVGFRQVAGGGGNWNPWCNAPAGSRQRLSLFLHLSPHDAKHAFDDALRYTRDDRFDDLPGHVTFTSHYHMAIAETAMRRPTAERDTVVPEFVDVFKNMNVRIVHLGEFHGDGHPKDPGPLRLPEMEAMFRECRRLSDDKLLLIPGEEINEWLGNAAPGRHPGHWMSLFPKPVYWMQKRAGDAPFVEDDPKYGKVYRVGSREDMTRLIAAEKALVWSAHPRIKASSWAPDAFREEAFYKDASWLGAAFKAMPADLSHDRLGKRCLDLLDDMANWGDRKYLPGEVDVFKIDRTHELYGHMNINYLRLEKAPRYDDGWQTVCDTLQHGAFFTTTGEVLVKSFTVGGKQSGETLVLDAADESPEVQVELSWTFPPEFAEIISGDGKEVFRERIDLSGEEEFSGKTLTLRPNLTGRKWVRFEIWDTAVNGAYTQPVWIERK